MEKAQDGESKAGMAASDPPVLVRRKRKAARQQREKTPEVAKTERRPSDEGSVGNMDGSSEVITAELQLRMPPPATASIGSHKSKILSRRNKSVHSAAARSSSTPRQENNVEPPETYDFLRVARRSLSSPRHKEESSESGRSSPYPPQPAPPQRTIPPRSEGPSPHMASADLSSDSQTNSIASARLENNLKKFEEERRKFELERKRFEREKRELTKMRFKLTEPSDRSHLAEIYRRLSDRDRKSSGLGDKQMLLERFLEAQHQAALDAKHSARRGSLGDETEETDREPPPLIECPDYESSTATMSESEISTIDADETDADDEGNNRPLKVREKRSNFSHSSTPTSLRNRRHKKNSLVEPMPTQTTIEEAKPKPLPKTGIVSRFLSIFSFKKKLKKVDKPEEPLNLKVQPPGKSSTPGIVRLILHLIFFESRETWRSLKKKYPEELRQMRLQRNKCISDLIIIIILCGFGGMLFRFVEGKLENTYKCGVGRVKRDFIDHLWMSSHNLREEDWKSQARMKLRKFEEELHAAHESGMTSYSGMRSWNFLNSLIYCWTVVTTIGYGHISPTTVVGRAVTIVYAIIGIPMFLILLADFGKLFTRCIKFVWVFVRRLYYTGTFRQIRKHQHVQQMVHGMNIVYEIAMRRPTIADVVDALDAEKGDGEPHKTPGTPPVQLDPHGSIAETPTSPAPETFLIDDEFNLPISVAIVILLLYIFLGAAVYCIWEDWTYFESIYFVFISMSTIGFGDFVPQHPIFMMCSIAYLIFGLALTSMCINVVQLKLSNSFKQASAKIGATIGFEMSEEEAMSTQNITPLEMPSIPPSPKLERPPTANSSPEYRLQHISTESPPPLPRRSPINREDSEKSSGKEKGKRKKSKK